MTKDHFTFNLYRMLIQDDLSVFPGMMKPAHDDENIMKIAKSSTEMRLDKHIKTKVSLFIWSLRNYVEYSNTEDNTTRVFSLTLARSLERQTGKTVTDSGIVESLSELNPPLIDIAINIFFFLERHLIAVEYNSTLMRSSKWLDITHEILDSAAEFCRFTSQIRLEPIPYEEELLTSFRSFAKLTRLRAHLVIPNPDLSNLTKKLYEEMSSDGIVEWISEMRNPFGLSQSVEGRPHAIAALAQEGYKKGHITMEGIVDGNLKTIKTGEKAAIGEVDIPKVDVDAIINSPNTSKSKRILIKIINAVNRICGNVDTKK